MAFYMVLVLVILLFFGDMMWDLTYKKSDKFYDESGVALDKVVHYTIIFNTFIFMQIFNEFNCRMVGPKQFNVFANLMNNWYFIGVVGGTVALQLVFVQYAG
jgi:magnesium-transporting ATPase (P-type)